MGDERDPNEETMDEGKPLDRGLEGTREDGRVNVVSTERDLPALRPTDTDPEQVKLVDRSTISESAATEARPIDVTPSPSRPPGKVTKTRTLDEAASTADQEGRGAPKKRDLNQLTQETPFPFSIIAKRDSLREVQNEEIEPAPTRKLSAPNLDKIKKGTSIPAGVFRRVMEGLDAPEATPQTPDKDSDERSREGEVQGQPPDWDDEAAELPTEPMNQDAFVAALAASELASGALESDVDGAPTPAVGQSIVSLADLVDHNATASVAALGEEEGSEAFEETSPTKQTRRPRSRFIAQDSEPLKDPQRVARQTTRPPRPAVIRSSKPSIPARPAQPPVVRPATLPAPEVPAEPNAPNDMPTTESESIPKPLESKGSVREIPLPGEPGSDGDGPHTVVKRKRNLSPKRLVLGASVAEQRDEKSPPTAIPIQPGTGPARTAPNPLKAGDTPAPPVSLPPADVPSVSVDEPSEVSSGRFRSVLAAVIDEASVVGVLRVVEGQAEGQVFSLNKAENSVGRGADNDVVLLDLGVSRRHVTIVRHADGFQILDDGSGNGSYVNGLAVTEAELYDGDIIRLGGTEMEYRTQGAPRVQPMTGIDQARPWARLGRLGVITFIATFLTMLVLDWFTPTVPERLAERGAAEWVIRADDEADERQWGDAHQSLLVSRAFGAHADQDELARRIEQETKNASVFGRLERDIANRASIQTLEGRLRSINEESVYRGLAGLQVRAAKKATLERTLDDAEQDLKKGRNEAARLKIESVLHHNAAHPRAKSLLDSLN